MTLHIILEGREINAVTGRNHARPTPQSQSMCHILLVFPSSFSCSSSVIDKLRKLEIIELKDFDILTV